MLSTIQRFCVILSMMSAIILAQHDHILTDDFIATINRRATTWRATRNFNSTASIAGLASSLPEKQPGRWMQRRQPRINHNQMEYQLPAYFDARSQWPYCPSIGMVRYQGQCSSCWAIAAANTMTDRVCIHSRGAQIYHLSTHELITCCDGCRNNAPICGGGTPSRAWLYWQKTGVVTGGPYGSQHNCKPYAFPPYRLHWHTMQSVMAGLRCDYQCQPSYGRDYVSDRRYASSVYKVERHPIDIMREIYLRGPVQALLWVYMDFFSYQAGVYIHVAGDLDAGHSVRIIGWGEEYGTPYWLVVNSWGTGWGRIGGYFKILRGQNHCGIEEEIYAGLPR